MSINESMRLTVLGEADQALDRIGTFPAEVAPEWLFLPMSNEAGCNLVVEQLAKIQYSNIKVIKISQTVLCAYKNEVSHPEEFYQRLWMSRMRKLSHSSQ